MKFGAFVTAAAVAVASAAAANASLPACPTLDFTDAQQTLYIQSLNGVIDLAVQTGLLAQGLAQADPINVANQTLDAVPFSVLGTDFSLVPTIKTLQVTGLKNISPNHVNVSGPTGLNLSALVNGTLDLSAQFSVQISQPNRQWWQLCWVNLLDPINCKPGKPIDVTVDLSLTKPTVFADVLVPLKGCPDSVPYPQCVPLMVTDLLMAAYTQQFAPFLTKFERRLVKASLADFQLTFDTLNNISLQFDKSTQLLKSIAEDLYNITEKEINKHDVAYKAFTKTVNALVKSLVNKLLDQSINKLAGGNCYDA